MYVSVLGYAVGFKIITDSFSDYFDKVNTIISGKFNGFVIHAN